MSLYAYPAAVRRDRAGRYVVRFPDLPEALTDGATQEEAFREAADCVSEALMSRIVDGEEIPAPSRPKHGQHAVSPDSTVALKAALYTALRERGVSAAELARRLEIDRVEARRLLDPRHPTRFPRLAAALESLGYDVTITVRDASQQGRLLGASGSTVRPTRATRSIRLDSR